MSRDEITYKPPRAAYEGSKIIIILRDRDISNAQESGFNPEWFEHEDTKEAKRLMRKYET